MRRVLLRSVAVFIVGAAVLVGILYYASTVDSRAPGVTTIGLTQHLASDETVALASSGLAVSFSEPVDAVSAESAFRLQPTVRGSFSWSGSTMIFTPLQPLPLSTDFTASIGPGVRDGAGNVMTAQSAPFQFKTVGEPGVVDSDPADGATDVALDASIQITFSTLMDTASVTDALSIAPSIDYRLRWSGEQLRMVPSQPLDPGTSYEVRIGAAAQAAGGASLATPFSLTFTTVAAGLSPSIVVPADGLQGVAVTSPIAIGFDRALDPSTVSADLLQLTPSVAGTLEAIAPPGGTEAPASGSAVTILRFQPSGPLPPNTTFEVTLAGDLRAVDGARLVKPVSWSFLTGAPSAALSNEILFLSDRSGVTNLWAMNPDGSGQRQLSAELSPIVSYAVSPAGNSFIVGDGTRLVAQRADGGERRVLTEDGLIEFDPAYSPDGSQIVFGRADAATGAGMGLWLRPPGGGDATRIELPAELTASPSPAPSAGGPPAPLLRAPTFSPDGAALAFVLGDTRVAVLELPAARLTTAPFDAMSAPFWLPDSSGVLLSGIPAAETQSDQPPGVVLPLSPASRGLEGAELARLRAVRLDRGAASVTDAGLPQGAWRPIVDTRGHLVYVLLGPAPRVNAGSLWLTVFGSGAGRRISPSTALVTSAAFTPDPDRLVVARAAPIPSTPPLAGASPPPEHGGIWLVSLSSGIGEQRSADGWLPRWIP